MSRSGNEERSGPVASHGSARRWAALGAIVCVVLLVVAALVLLQGDELLIGPSSNRPGAPDKQSSPQPKLAGEAEIVRRPVETTVPPREFWLYCVDADKRPVPNVRLEFTDIQGRSEGVVDAAGRFHGSFRSPLMHVVASAPGCGRATASLNSAIEADWRKTLQLNRFADVDVTVLDGRSLSVPGSMVTLRVAGVTEEARGLPASPAAVVADGSGLARFHVDGYGIYSVSATTPSGVTSDKELVHVRPGIVTDVTLHVGVSQTIRGVVLDRDGQPVPNAKVIAALGSGFVGEPQRSAGSTGSDGHFAIIVKKPGSYVLSAQKEGMLLMAPVSCKVTPDLADMVRIEMARQEALSGVLTDKAGLPVAGARVWAEYLVASVDDQVEATTALAAAAARTLVAQSDASGRFTFGGAIPVAGEWRIVAEQAGPDIVRVGDRLLLCEGGSLDGSMVLSSWHPSAGGVFVDVSGESERVEVLRCRRKELVWDRTWESIGESAVPGHVSLPDDMPGSALMILGRTNGAMSVGKDLCEVLGDRRLVLKPLGSLRVTLTGDVARAAWLPTARVMLHRLDGLPLQHYDMDKIDSLEFGARRLLPGGYSVSVIDGWRVRARSSVKIGDAEVRVDLVCQ